jgi:hypothetical protein
MAVVGAAIGPDNDDDANWAQRNRNTLILAGGGILSVPATIMLKRSADAAKASAEAGSNVSARDDPAALDKCKEARAYLVSARGQSADSVEASLKDKIDAVTNAKVSAEASKLALEKDIVDPDIPQEKKAELKEELKIKENFLKSADEQLRMLMQEASEASEPSEPSEPSKIEPKPATRRDDGIEIPADSDRDRTPEH